jgi:hypothetical protein
VVPIPDEWEVHHKRRTILQEANTEITWELMYGKEEGEGEGEAGEGPGKGRPVQEAGAE